MKNTLLSLSLGLVLSGMAGHVWAEKADRNKPMNVEADALRYDDLKQVSIFTGNVVLTKGSIVIRGAQLEVRQDPDGYQFGVVTGSATTPAFFRQKRDGIDEFIEGDGETIEYDGRADTVRFIKKAQLRRLRGATLADEVTGAVILYENLSDKFTVDGAPKSATAPAGRVRAMLTPKPDTAAPATPNQSGTTLRTTPQLEKTAQ
ncbi:MAG: lipopolysaccharide transport periplasmic protein LptA [Burkholderiaceae bacterium]|nr:lipopolysaccharide transport periplasmic protein LptA [Burkholderiaceae bacterium]